MQRFFPSGTLRGVALRRILEMKYDAAGGQLPGGRPESFSIAETKEWIDEVNTAQKY